MNIKTSFIVIALLALISPTAFSKEIKCEFKLNLDTVYSKTVSTSLNQKNLIGEIDEVTAFITEAPNGQLTIEAYLPDFDARIYGQGSITNASDKVAVSIWGRPAMIDVICALASK